MSHFTVKKSGVLALLQDEGRYGYHALGLTTGGPMDSLAFRWANHLCGNTSNAVAIELSVGGLHLIAQARTLLAVCGAPVPFTINTKPCEQWRSYTVHAGDEIQFGFSANACRAYIAISGGFKVAPQFGSAATVVREGVGGLSGQALKAGDVLPCAEIEASPCVVLPEQYRPHYASDITVRVLASYQYSKFSDTQKQHFFNSVYIVSAHCDRMAYRLESPKPMPSSASSPMLSEGICLGAIQIPPNGQPIVMLADRQTIGGYPKLATVLSIDLAKLAQCVAGNTVRFQLISEDHARVQLILTQQHFQRALALLEPVGG